MMTKRFILLFTALAFILAGCDKDDGGRRNKAVEQTLYQLYPDASHLDWDYDGNYVVVDFRSAIASDSRAAECEAWFDYNGSWYLTEFDIRFNELPAAVINAFNSSAYGSWYVEDVERIDRVGYASVYIIQVEDRTNSNDMEYDLYYDAQGILIKEIADGPDFGGNYGDLLPPTGSDYTAIREFIKSKYPNGQIVDIERESNGYTDVDIIDNRISKDVIFDASGNWLYTTYAELGDYKKAEESLDLIDCSLKAPQMDYGYERAVQLYKGIVKPEDYIDEEEMAKVVIDRPNRVHFEESHMLYGLYWYWMIHGDEKKAYDAIKRLQEIGYPGTFGLLKSQPIAKKLGIIK